MHLPATLISVLALLLTSFSTESSRAQSPRQEGLAALEGTWLYVEDRTEGRPDEKHGPPMNAKFRLRVEEDAVIYPRPRGDERITLDGSVIEKKDDSGSIARYRGEWKDGALVYTLKREYPQKKESRYELQRIFRAVDGGLLVHVIYNGKTSGVALYRHPEDIALPEPARASIDELGWLAGAWTGTRRTSTIEERWSPPGGGALLGVARTVRSGKMLGFEYLRIVERDGGLVYVAQPGGKPPTEFVLTELSGKRAVFVNPRHDYPQRIIYELGDENVLTTSIGFARKGRLQSSEYGREES